MHAVVVWWDLTESTQTIESLRVYLREEGIEPFSQFKGLRLKYWISDQATNRWGAAFLWESVEASTVPMPPKATELIGYPPTHSFAFDVEATVEGIHSGADLAALGLVFDRSPQTAT
jgi:hypothetical protein